MNISKDLMRDWLQSLAVTNCSEHTLSAYSRDVLNLIEFMDTDALKLSEVTQSHIQAFANHRLEEHGISSSSLQRELSSIRQFYAWLMQHQHITTNPLLGFKIKRAIRKLPEMVDVDTISQLLDQPAPQTNNTNSLILWVRDKAMLELLYSSGLRVAELTELTTQDINFSDKQLIVQAGKGNKTRIVPMGQKAIDALQVWLKQRQHWLTDTNEAYIFISKPTKAKPAGRISTRTVQRRIQHHAKRAGIDKRMYPHLMRHCFASHMLSGSGDLRAVQELLGHANISTTQIYTHLDFEKLTQVYDNSHPRARAKSKKNLK